MNCARCDGTGREPSPTGMAQIGAPSCLACGGSGLWDADTIHVSTQAERGGPHPCPKDGSDLTLIEADADRLAGAWCPECGTVFREVDEVSLDDLDLRGEA